MGVAAYTLTFNGLTFAANGTQPFLQIATPATQGIEILSLFMGQETSEVSQQECITLTRRSAASTMAAGLTPIATREKDGASLLVSGTTANGSGVTATAAGTLVSTPLIFPFNALNGLLYLPLPEERITIGPSGFLTIQFKTAPAANTWSGQLIFRELA
jgi:hypothetical protein